MLCEWKMLFCWQGLLQIQCSRYPNYCNDICTVHSVKMKTIEFSELSAVWEYWNICNTSVTVLFCYIQFQWKSHIFDICRLSHPVLQPDLSLTWVTTISDETIIWNHVCRKLTKDFDLSTFAKVKVIDMYCRIMFKTIIPQFCSLIEFISV